MRQECEWTAKRVEIRLEEAAQTLRCLPGAVPKAMLCSWPAIIRDYWELYCDSDPLPRRRSATPKQVTEMDEALLWMHWLDPKAAKVVWMRACHIRWRVIAERMHMSERGARQYRSNALATIAARLEKRCHPHPYPWPQPLSSTNTC
jgi:hypothetical protein